MKLRIMPDGTICGLWDDAVDWTSLGPVSVQRASHVEFCPRHQQWYVQSGRPLSWWRRFLQRVLRRPFGEILHTVTTRSEALAWEREHFGPGGPGWPETRERSRAQTVSKTPEDLERALGASPRR